VTFLRIYFVDLLDITCRNQDLYIFMAMYGIAAVHDTGDILP